MPARPPSSRPRRLRALPAVLALFLPAFPVFADEPPIAPQEPPDEQPATPGYFKDDGEARGRAVAGKRGIALDIDAVHAAQEETLAYQAHDAGEAWFSASTNWLCHRLDAFHDETFLLLDNLVRTLDLTWTLTGSDYRAELSSLTLSPMARIGGRGDAGDSDFKLKLRIDTALPGLERRFHLVFDNMGRDSLPGSDPLKQESDWRLGVRSDWDAWHDIKFDLDSGLRLRSMHVVGYGRASLKWNHDLAGGVFRVSPSVFYYTDRAWGQDFRTSWQRWFGPGGHWGIELLAAEENTDRHSTYDFEHTIKIAYSHSPRKTRGWIFQASLFPCIREGNEKFYLDDALVNLSWKSPVYRRWCYATVTPQVDFAREDDRHPRFSLRFALEILFGGESRRLL